MINQSDIDAFMAMEEFADLDDYQKKAVKFAIYDRKKFKVVYPSLGLTSEAGEVADKIKKWLRDGKVDKEEVAKEIGDVLWYCAVLADDLGFSLSDIAHLNMDKLKKRKATGKLRGSGDNR